LTKKVEKVTWEKPDSGGAISDGTDGYKIEEGTFGDNSQTTILTVPAAKNTADATYTCVIQCDEHGKTAHKEDVISNVFSECLHLNFTQF